MNTRIFRCAYFKASSLICLFGSFVEHRVKYHARAVTLDLLE